VTADSLFRPEDLRFEFDARALVQRLREVLPGDGLIEDEVGRRTYECDALAAYRQLPLLVALPSTTEQVQAIMRICSELGVPVVARGSGTSLSGGSLPHPQGVLLSLGKFNRILEIDPGQRTARVQPGVRNLAVSEAAAPYDLYYAPDPSSQIACSIGGNVGENAGGVHCLKYGLTVHNVLAAEVVTADGERLSIGSTAPDTPGYDLLGLMIGSEGMLGVITEVTVKLLPKPPATQALLAGFPTVDSAGAAVAGLIGAGIIPAGLEMMDNAAIRAAEDFVHAGYPLEAAAILICELDGHPEEVKAQMHRVEALMREFGANDIRVARDDAQRLRFWAGRKAAFPAVGAIGPDYYCMDGTIPRKQLAHVLTRMQELSEEYGQRVVNVFHAGDGNLHPLILYDISKPGELARTEALGGRILELCVEVGGTITGEHGVGIEKIDQMCVQFSPIEIAQFHAVKAAWDPAGLLNPGKAIPTLNRCAEFGAMHVRGGELPHPEIERF
jgi:glycolate oxidase